MDILRNNENTLESIKNYDVEELKHKFLTENFIDDEGNITIKLLSCNFPYLDQYFLHLMNFFIYQVHSISTLNIQFNLHEIFNFFLNSQFQNIDIELVGSYVYHLLGKSFFDSCLYSIFHEYIDFESNFSEKLKNNPNDIDLRFYSLQDPLLMSNALTSFFAFKLGYSYDLENQRQINSLAYEKRCLINNEIINYSILRIKDELNTELMFIKKLPRKHLFTCNALSINLSPNNLLLVTDLNSLWIPIIHQLLMIIDVVHPETLDFMAFPLYISYLSRGYVCLKSNIENELINNLTANFLNYDSPKKNELDSIIEKVLRNHHEHDFECIFLFLNFISISQKYLNKEQFSELIHTFINLEFFKVDNSSFLHTLWIFLKNKVVMIEVIYSFLTFLAFIFKDKKNSIFEITERRHCSKEYYHLKFLDSKSKLILIVSKNIKNALSILKETYKYFFPCINLLPPEEKSYLLEHYEDYFLKSDLEKFKKYQTLLKENIDFCSIELRNSLSHLIISSNKELKEIFLNDSFHFLWKINDIKNQKSFFELMKTIFFFEYDINLCTSEINFENTQEVALFWCKCLFQGSENNINEGIRIYHKYISSKFIDLLTFSFLEKNLLVQEITLKWIKEQKISLNCLFLCINKLYLELKNNKTEAITDYLMELIIDYFEVLNDKFNLLKIFTVLDYFLSISTQQPIKKVHRELISNKIDFLFDINLYDSISLNEYEKIKDCLIMASKNEPEIFSSFVVFFTHIIIKFEYKIDKSITRILFNFYKNNTLFYSYFENILIYINPIFLIKSEKKEYYFILKDLFKNFLKQNKYEEILLFYSNYNLKNINYKLESIRQIVVFINQLSKKKSIDDSDLFYFQKLLKSKKKIYLFHAGYSVLRNLTEHSSSAFALKSFLTLIRDENFLHCFENKSFIIIENALKFFQDPSPNMTLLNCQLSIATYLLENFFLNRIFSMYAFETFDKSFDLLLKLLHQENNISINNDFSSFILNNFSKIFTIIEHENTLIVKLIECVELIKPLFINDDKVINKILESIIHVKMINLTKFKGNLNFIENLFFKKILPYPSLIRSFITIIICHQNTNVSFTNETLYQMIKIIKNINGKKNRKIILKNVFNLLLSKNRIDDFLIITKELPLNYKSDNLLIEAIFNYAVSTDNLSFLIQFVPFFLKLMINDEKQYFSLELQEKILNYYLENDSHNSIEISFCILKHNFPKLFIDHWDKFIDIINETKNEIYKAKVKKLFRTSEIFHSKSETLLNLMAEKKETIEKKNCSTLEEYIEFCNSHYQSNIIDEKEISKYFLTRLELNNSAYEDLYDADLKYIHILLKFNVKYNMEVGLILLCLSKGKLNQKSNALKYNYFNKFIRNLNDVSFELIQSNVGLIITLLNNYQDYKYVCIKSLLSMFQKSFIIISAEYCSEIIKKILQTISISRDMQYSKQILLLINKLIESPQINLDLMKIFFDSKANFHHKEYDNITTKFMSNALNLTIKNSFLLTDPLFISIFYQYFLNNINDELMQKFYNKLYIHDCVCNKIVFINALKNHFFNLMKISFSKTSNEILLSYFDGDSPNLENIKSFLPLKINNIRILILDNRFFIHNLINLALGFIMYPEQLLYSEESLDRKFILDFAYKIFKFCFLTEFYKEKNLLIFAYCDRRILFHRNDLYFYHKEKVYKLLKHIPDSDLNLKNIFKLSLGSSEFKLNRLQIINLLVPILYKSLEFESFLTLTQSLEILLANSDALLNQDSLKYFEFLQLLTIKLEKYDPYDLENKLIYDSLVKLILKLPTQTKDSKIIYNTIFKNCIFALSYATYAICKIENVDQHDKFLQITNKVFIFLKTIKIFSKKDFTFNLLALWQTMLKGKINQFSPQNLLLHFNILARTLESDELYENCFKHSLKQLFSELLPEIKNEDTLKNTYNFLLGKNILSK